MASKKLKFKISAIDGFSKVLKNARKSIRSFSRFAKGAFRGIRFAGRWAFRGLAATAVGLGAALKQSFRFETWEAMFGRMYNSVEKGKDAVKELTMLAAKTPFTIPGVIAASRQVQVFTDNARGGIKDMIMLGDAAAYVNANVEEVGFWFGRAYNAIEAGRPMGRAALRLQELGILSGKTRNLLEDMSKMKGSKKPSASAMLDVFISDFKRFEGTMSTLVGTGDQLFSNLLDIGIWSLKTLGDEIKDLAKGRMAELTKAMIKLSEDGTIKKWGENINSVLITVEGKVRNLIEWVKKFQGADQGKKSKMIEEVTTSFFDALSVAFDKLKPKFLEVGEIIAKGFLNAIKKGLKSTFWDNSVEVKQVKKNWEGPGKWMKSIFGGDQPNNEETTVIVPAPDVTVDVEAPKPDTPDVIVNVPAVEKVKVPDWAMPTTKPEQDENKGVWNSFKKSFMGWFTGESTPLFKETGDGKKDSSLKKLSNLFQKAPENKALTSEQKAIQELLKIQIKWQKRLADINKKKKLREERDAKKLPPMRPTHKPGETMAQWLKDIEKDERRNKQIRIALGGTRAAKREQEREIEKRKFFSEFDSNRDAYIEKERMNFSRIRKARRGDAPAFDLPPLTPPPTVRSFRSGGGSVFTASAPMPVRIMNPEFVEKE